MFRTFTTFTSLRLIIAASAVLICLVVFQNCAPRHSNQGYIAEPSIDYAALLADLQSDALLILENKCAQCHNDPSVTSNLKSILDPAYLVSNNYIVDGEPQNSLLYLKIIDQLMPPAGETLLSDIEVDKLRDWIAARGDNWSTVIGPPGVGGGGGGSSIGTYQAVRSILNARCVGCHGGTPPNLGGTYQQLLASRNATNEPTVTPGNPTLSRLYQSVVGNSMPKNQLPLSNADKESIRSWIASGAPNN